MTPPAAAPASSKTDRTPSSEAVLLEALAAAGESLTYAIVHHDLDAIVAATSEAELLMATLTTRDAARRTTTADTHGGHAKAPETPSATAVHADTDADTDAGAELAPPDPAAILLSARIGATARRNALLLEHAWATDAALLRLLATAARSEAAASRGTGYARPAASPSADAVPAGWLDRQA